MLINSIQILSHLRSYSVAHRLYQFTTRTLHLPLFAMKLLGCCWSHLRQTNCLSLYHLGTFLGVVVVVIGWPAKPFHFPYSTYQTTIIICSHFLFLFDYPAFLLISGFLDIMIHLFLGIARPQFTILLSQCLRQTYFSRFG